MLSFLAVKEKKEQRKKEYQFVRKSIYFTFLSLSQENMCCYLEDFDCYSCQQPFLLTFLDKSQRQNIATELKASDTIRGLIDMM